jgi:hypothetical protein
LPCLYKLRKQYSKCVDKQKPQTLRLIELVIFHATTDIS